LLKPCPFFVASESHSRDFERKQRKMRSWWLRIEKDQLKWLRRMNIYIICVSSLLVSMIGYKKNTWRSSCYLTLCHLAIFKYTIRCFRFIFSLDDEGKNPPPPPPFPYHHHHHHQASPKKIREAMTKSYIQPKLSIGFFINLMMLGSQLLIIT